VLLPSLKCGGSHPPTGSSSYLPRLAGGTCAKRSAEPALGEVEGDLLFLSIHPIVRLLINVTALPFVIPSVPGFPTSRLYRRQRMRLSIKRAA
jgi:hypothetical protein